MMTETQNKFRHSSSSFVIWSVFLAVGIFFIWASVFNIQKTVRSIGVVQTTSRIQIIQSVDGGVLSNIFVSEGDIVVRDQLLVQFDQVRFSAQSNEIKSRVLALEARAQRLRGEVTGVLPVFSDEVLQQENFAESELSVYRSRLTNLAEQAEAFESLLSIASAEADVLRSLFDTGDISQMELLNAERAVVEARSRLNSLNSEFVETAAAELATVEDQLAQSREVLLQRESVVNASTLRAPVSGQVTNIKIANIGAVIQPGEELMRIVPSDSELYVEMKIKPADIADIEVGDVAILRFDAFDSSIFGSVSGEVSFVSGDVVAERGPMGDEQQVYVAHVRFSSREIITSIGRDVSLIPGMTAQVDVQAGTRTVLQYLFKPIVKTLGNSLSER